MSFVEGRRRSVILAFWNDTVPISQDKIGLKVLKSKIIRLIPGSSPRGFASLGRGRDEVPVAAKLKRNLALSPTFTSSRTPPRLARRNAMARLLATGSPRRQIA